MTHAEVAVGWPDEPSTGPRPNPRTSAAGNGHNPAPRDIDAERAVLGAMLLSPQAIDDVTPILTSADYYDTRHAAIYAAITAMAATGTPVDPITTAKFLAETGDLARIGGGPYLHTLLDAVPTVANATYYAEQVAAHATARNLTETLTRALNQIRQGTDPAEIRDNLTQRLAGTAPTGTAGRYGTPLDWHILFTGQTDQPAWEVEPIAERGQLVALYSRPGVGKSLLLGELVAALAAGKPVLGNPAQAARRVLYLDGENDPNEIYTRLSAMGHGPDDLANLIYISYPDLPPLDTPAGGAALYSMVTEYQAEIVTIDTVSRFVEGDENDAATWAACYRLALMPLRRLGTTVFRLDHEGKDPTRGQRGSSAKEADIDVSWRLIETSQTRFSLRREKTRTGRGREFVELVRRFEPLRHDLTFGPGALSDDVRDVVEELDRLGLPDDAGREQCRMALHKVGVKKGTHTLADAVRARKTRSESGESSVRSAFAEDVPLFGSDDPSGQPEVGE